MSRSDGPPSEERGGEKRGSEGRSGDGRGSEERSGEEGASREPVAPGAADWLAASTLRVGLTILGFVILLFAIGQAVGFDLLGIVVDALNTGIGRWLIVAFVGLFLIAFALKGFDDTRK